jgi:hypothetical protein
MRMSMLSGGVAGPGRFRPSRLLPLLVVALLFAGATAAFGITRATILSRAQSWVDVPIKYSQSKYYHGYRTDCSGFTSMAWQTTVRAHAYSYTTRSLHNVSSVIAPQSLQPGDALVKYNYHAKIFYGWVDASHTTYVCYEQTGPTTKSSIKNLAADLAFGYKPYRRGGVSNGPPAWNAVANPTFDVWASNAPVWWVSSGGTWGSTIAVRTTAVHKSGKSALGLLNPSGRALDVVSISQTSKVATGVPYALSVWARTSGDTAGLELRIQFLDAAGATLLTKTTTGASWSVEATRLVQMSIATTAPATATSATISVRLAGGVDASGTAGTKAVLDDFRLFKNSPVSSSIALSTSTVSRGHSLTVSGRVTAPIPAGSVRIYLSRPGRTTPFALRDVPLRNGAWSFRFGPTLRGTYTFSAKYLGYGPYGPVTSPRASVRVK